jgi:5-methylcytosine-specific restriction endonuclease McrA
MKSNVFEKIDFIKLYKEHPFCFYCKTPLEFKEVEFDHFYPVSKGGSHTLENIRVACSICNRRKGAMTYQVV